MPIITWTTGATSFHILTLKSSLARCNMITEDDQFPATVTVFKKDGNVQVLASQLVSVDVDGTIHKILKNGAVARFNVKGKKVLKLRWKSKWWVIPSMDDIERWTFDSVCETPDGNIVEPDATDSWLRLLNLV